MADSVVVSALLELKDKLSPGLKNAAQNFGAVQASASKMKADIGSLASGVGGLSASLAGLAASAGFGLSAKAALDLASQFEDTALSIAGNIKAFDLAPTFAASVGEATKALTLIDAMAAKLPGETEQYIQVFKTALPKAIESGLGSVQQVADFTSRYTAVAVSNQIDAMQAGMDLARILGGQAGLDVRTWSVLNPHLKVTAETMKMLGPQAKGLALGTTITAQQFNKLNITARRLLVENALGKFDDSIKAASNTFSSKMGEMTARVKELTRVGSEPMFEGAKESLDKINEALARNRKELIRIGTEGGTLLASAIDKGTKATVLMLDNFDAVLDATKAIAATLATMRVMPAVIGFVESLAGFAGAGAIGTWLAGLSAGALALATGVGYAIAEGMMFAMKSMGTWDAFADYASSALNAIGLGEGTTFSDLKKRDLLTSSIESTGRLQFRNDISKMLGDLSSSKRVGEMQRMLGTAKSETVKADLLEVARNLNIKLPTKAKPDINFNNNRFDITQKFAEGFDPDRIAVAFAQDLGRMGEMRVQSAMAPTAGLVR